MSDGYWNDVDNNTAYRFVMEIPANVTTSCVSEARTSVSLTIESAPAVPTGDAAQSFCDSATVSDLQVTGENIQWYDAATSGNLLASTASLNDGQVVYASQTIDGCEGTSRLAVTVSLQVNELTASATEICTGESVDLSVSLSSDSTLLWSTGDTSNTSTYTSNIVHGSANEGDNLTLTAPSGTVFTAVNFASYGTPNGSAGSFSIGNCHASNSQTIV